MKLLESLNTLPREVLQQLVAKGALLLNGKKAAPVDESGIGLVHDQITLVLEAYGEKRAVPLFVVKRQNFFKGLEEHALRVLAFVDHGFRPRNKVERVRALYLSLRILAANIVERGLPVSYRTLVSNLGLIGEAVDEEFPGYRECGLLHVVLTRKPVE